LGGNYALSEMYLVYAERRPPGVYIIRICVKNVFVY